MSFLNIIEKLSEKFMGAFEQTESRIKRTMDLIENKIELVIKRIKKKLLRVVFELTLFAIGIVFLLAGLVKFFTRFFPLDAVLIVTAAACLYMVLMLHMAK